MLRDVDLGFVRDGFCVDASGRGAGIVLARGRWIDVVVGDNRAIWDVTATQVNCRFSRFNLREAQAGKDATEADGQHRDNGQDVIEMGLLGNLTDSLKAGIATELLPGWQA